MGRKSLKTVRQKEIIEAFYIVAKKEGLENTSIAKVAKEMGVNNSLIMHYFSSKDKLIFELINYILEQYKSLYVINNNINIETKLKKTIDNLFSRDWNNLIDDGVFYSCFSLIFRDLNIKEAFKEVHILLREFLEKVIEEAKNNNIINIVDAKETADLIFILVEGSYYYLSLYNINEAEYKAKIENYKKAALNILNFKPVFSA